MTSMLQCKDWQSECLNKVRLRNAVESEPFVGIIKSYENLYYRNSSMKRHELETRKDLGAMKMDIQDFINKYSKSASAPRPATFSLDFLGSLKANISRLHFEMRELDFDETIEKNVRYDISRAIKDYTTKIKDQNLEIITAKQELMRNAETIVSLESNISSKDKLIAELTAEIERRDRGLK